MNLLEKVTRQYAATMAAYCHHVNMVRSVRIIRSMGYPNTVYIARCPDCPALAGSVYGPPSVEPWFMGLEVEK